MVLFPRALRLPALGVTGRGGFDGSVRNALNTQALHLVANHPAKSTRTLRPTPRMSLLVIGMHGALVVILMLFHRYRLAAFALAVMVATTITVSRLVSWPAATSVSRPHFDVLKGGLR